MFGRHLLLALPLVMAALPASKWEPDISRFEEQDKVSPPSPGGNLFVGSSTIRIWDVASSFPGYPVINRGFGGSQISDCVAFASRIISPYKPKVIVFYSGDNDIAFGKSPEQVFEDFKALRQFIRDNLPEARFVVISIKPCPQRWPLADKMKKVNELVGGIARGDDHMTFIDVWSTMLGQDGKPRPELYLKDGLHLSPEGHKLWIPLIQPLLVK